MFLDENTVAQPLSSVLGDLVKVAEALRTAKGTSQYKHSLSSESYWQGYDAGIG